MVRRQFTREFKVEAVRLGFDCSRSFRLQSGCGHRPSTSTTRRSGQGHIWQTLPIVRETVVEDIRRRPGTGGDHVRRESSGHK